LFLPERLRARAGYLINLIIRYMVMNNKQLLFLPHAIARFNGLADHQQGAAYHQPKVTLGHLQKYPT
jgi:hypothetical protein